MRASIIINTYNRAAYLRRLLASLGHLKGVEFEVVVVNGPSTDDTPSVLERYRDRIKVVDCPARNLSQSRNLGIAAAAGDIVVFIDDDAIPCDSEWLARYVQAFQNEQIGAAWGPVLHRDTDWFEFREGATSEYGFQTFAAPKSERAPDGREWVKGGQGCNIAFHRDRLVSIGGFDEFYTYYLDETDVCLRLARAGYRGVNLPLNPVRHYSASSERRTSPYNRNWDVIARSDTYFALKNGHDPLPIRLLKTLRFAPQKHFVREIDAYWKQGEISFSHWLRLRGKWLRGLLQGLWSGLTQRRRLGDFKASPPPFLPFRPLHADHPLRIALLTQTVPGQPNYGGIGRYTYDLACGLHERGHEVHIICRDEQKLHYEGLGFVIHGLSARETAPRPIAGDRPILNKNLTYALAVERKLRELYADGIEFDVVHASNWDTEAVVLIREGVYPTALMLVTPLAQVVQTEKWQLNDDLQSAIVLDRWQIEHADAICVPSRGVLASYQKLMGLDPDKIEHLYVTPLGIIPGGLSINMANKERKPPYKLLFVGRLEWRKGIHTLLEILPGLMERFPDWECHLVGDDSIPAVEGKTFRQWFQEKYHGRSWLNRVVFHGVVSETELRYHYQTCDLFVAPSMFESFGLIFQEAMQYGKAVVGCRTGGIPEVVTHGEEGLLVTPNNPQELGMALAELMQDESLRKRMGNAGRRRIQERDNYLTMAMNLEKVYYDLIQTKGEQYKARRRHWWPNHELPLLVSNDSVQWSGPWQLREAVPGETYCMGMAGASVEFIAREGSLLELVVLRHDWSGVLEVMAGEVRRYIDLYSQQLELNHSVQIRLPDNNGESIRVKLRVHSVRHPQSHGTEVWLKRILTVLPLS